MFNQFIDWFTVPHSTDMDPINFRNVQIDAIGVGLATAAAPFLPVFLARMGASPFQVGLLTTMPAVAGLLLSIPLGQFLQSRSNIIPWFSFARLTQLSGYALTGLLSLFLPNTISVIGILLVWALITIPQTVLNITFSVVMNSVAGPDGRFELMTHRWSVLGVTSTIVVILAGQFLDWQPFPRNFQLLFIALSIGGVISYLFSSQLRLKPVPKVEAIHKGTFIEQIKEYIGLILKEKPFVNFILHRFVFLTGASIVAPLFPFYFVKVLHAPDSMIANIATAQTGILIFGYFYWTRQSRRKGSIAVLLATTFGTSLYPILTGMTPVLWPIILYAGMAGIFQAGLNLVFFDELMRRVPVEYSATFVATAQSIQFLSGVFAPLFGTWMAEHVIGFGPALIMGGLVSMLGFALFALDARHAPQTA